MIGIVKVLLPFVALFVAIYFMLYKRSRNNKRVHFLFPVQLFLALMSFGISVCWFTTGQEFLYNYGNFWDMVERGTLDSLSSVTGTIGVSCLFFGWTYSEREKVTLGYRQIDIVRYKYGFGYGLSIFIHFSATVLCSILLKCKAREAALTLLCVGYIRYLYLLDSKSINFRIQRIVYYVQQENNAYREFGIMLKALTNGLEWYHFITQRRDVPDSVVTCDSINSYINDAFIQLIVSIFEDDKQVERNAKIAWHQAYGGGTFE